MVKQKKNCYNNNNNFKMTPRDTQVNTSVNAQEIHDRRTRSPCGVNREKRMGGNQEGKKKRFPDPLNAFLPFPPRAKGLRGVRVLAPPRVRRSTNSPSSAATRSESHRPPRPFGGGTAPEPGQAQIPASREHNRSPPIRRFPSPGAAATGREIGRPGLCPRRSRCAPRPPRTHRHARSCPRPPVNPSRARTPGARGERGRGSGCARQLRACGCREETYPTGAGTDFSRQR